MADDELDDLDELGPKKSKLPLILGGVAVLVLLLGGGGAAAYFLMGSGDEGDTDGEEELADMDPVVHDLGKFTVNLRGGGGGRVLRMQMSVEMLEEAKDEEAEAEEIPLDDRTKAQLRDAVITLASDYTYGDLEGLDGKTRLRDELHGRLNTVLASNRVEHIYFTEFTVQ